MTDPDGAFDANTWAQGLRWSRETATLAVFGIALAALVFAACSARTRVEGDGSSTVFPIAEAVAEEFLKSQSDVDVVVGISGTGGGFQKFCRGETDFNTASRPIKETEVDSCAKEGIKAVEFEIAFDGLAVMTNPDNDFAGCLTVDELRRIWEPGSEIDSWSDIRPEWPDQALALYGPDTASGTFDYFSSEIVGEEGASRPDYTASADDNVLVQGIAGDRDSLGYFGFAFYEQNSDRLKLLSIDGGGGCVQPGRETILDGAYAPLSRPLFVYVREDALERPEVVAFMHFWLTEGAVLAAEVGYVELPEDVYETGLAKLPPPASANPR